MTKREVVWLIVRLAGLYFLWNAVTSSLGLFASLQLLDGAATPRGAGAVLLQALVVTAFYAVIGLYCVNDGRVFFNVLNREASE
ncbi:MAG TPA: hypothetical protein VGP08_18090 [Pyrinomonadaceae bacterium]|jgi:hypothetical protein|nr:hypothetical protein [Pyrinomonadaceae bacterium]